MSERGVYDGEPYYCVTCGVGIAEFMACEDGDCELESKEKAMQRRAEHFDRDPLDPDTK